MRHRLPKARVFGSAENKDCVLLPVAGFRFNAALSRDPESSVVPCRSVTGGAHLFEPGFPKQDPIRGPNIVKELAFTWDNRMRCRAVTVKKCEVVQRPNVIKQQGAVSSAVIDQVVRMHHGGFPLVLKQDGVDP